MAPARQPREESLVEALSRVPDARSRHGRRYQLGKVLALGVCAMAQWGREHCALVCEALGIERGETPCVAALHRVFRRLDVAAFEAVLERCLRARGLQAGEGIALLFAEPAVPQITVRQADRHGDRTEGRKLSVSSELNEWAEWPQLAQVGRVVHTRTRRGQTRTETSYLITSLPKEDADPPRLLQLVRGYWRTENCLHWVRDVTFDEDRCQVRSGAAPPTSPPPTDLAPRHSSVV